MKGFSYNIDLCVACHACVAGCFLENGTTVSWRKINQEPYKKYPGLPVHNISLACNHCSDAVCMEGCPANAYYRDESSGAVLLKSERCIGCNYCYWNCPYDAPAYNPTSRTIEKCTLCQERLDSGFNPACSSACPTGALRFCELDKTENEYIMADINLNPRLKIDGSINDTHDLNIVPLLQASSSVPQGSLSIDGLHTNHSKVNASSEWVLIVFSYLTSLLFAFNVSTYFGRIIMPRTIYLTLCLVTLFLPMVHLGKPLRAWRSVTGIFRSPLSTEIGFLLLFVASSLSASFFEIRIIWIISFISGLVLLITIDNVYSFSDRQLKTHTGQTFLTGLILSSFLLGEIVPFIFVALIKISALIYWSRRKNFSIHKLLQLIIYFLVLVLSTFAIHNAGQLYLIMFVILCISEILNRITYYIDFKPLSHIDNFYNNILRSYEKRQNSK